MATIIDTSLYKLNKNAFAILSGAYSKMPEIAAQAIDAYGSSLQPDLDAWLIEIGARADQIAYHLVFNANGTAIIGIKNEDVSVINAMLMCLRDVAQLGTSNHIPSPIVPIEHNECCGGYDVGPIGSILVSDGEKYLPVTPTEIGQVPIWDGTRVIWGASGGNGIPAGGLANQFLRKNTNLSYDASWQTFTLAMVTDVTSDADELNSLDGLDTANIGADQFNTLAGINTGLTIQAQLDLKMSAVLNNGQFFVGNAMNVATAVSPSGDVVFDNLGVFAIQSGVIVDDDISATADITRTKLAPGSAWRLVINGGDGRMATANGITPDRALISDGNGIPIASVTSSLALSYISTLGSDAQEQINSKLTVNAPLPEVGDILKYNGSEWINYALGAAGTALISTGDDAVWGPITGNGLPVGGSAQQFLRKATDDNYDTEWHTLVLADISDLTVTAAELNLLSGLTVNAGDINWLEGIDGNVQDQINSKMSNSLGYHNIWVGGPGDTAQQLGPGAEGSVLKIVGTSPVWQLPPTPGNVSGPVSSTDNAVVRFNGTTGDAIQDSLAILDDSGNMGGLASLSIAGQGPLNLFEASPGGNFVAIRASAVMAADYTITLPDAAPGSNEALTFDGVNYIWAPSGSGGATAFIDLTDVPNDYNTFGGYMVVVKGDESGLEFVPSTAGVGSVDGTADRITSTGGSNPVINIAATYAGQASITTLGTIGTGVWQGTPVGIAYGGTGSALTDPGADRILFWDESGNAVTWLEIGAGLSITGTVLTGAGSYTNEMAQDAVGTILADTATIAFVYTDEPTPSIVANVRTNSITATQFRQSAALSVVGNATNALANVTDIAAATDHQVLRRSGSTIGFGAVNLSSADAVTGALSITNGGTGGTAFTFLALTDTPDTYASQAGKFLVVNGTSDGIEFVPYVVPPYFLAKEVPAGVMNGVNQTFTLSFTPSPGSESVYLNGDLLDPGASNDYTISGAVITMNVPPEADSKLVVIFGGSSGWVGITDGNKGDINVSGTGSVWTINAEAVDFSKMQNVQQNRILGRFSSGTGDIEEMTGTQTNTMLPTFTYTLKGLVPAPTGSGSTRFLREDQQWVVPSGGGGGLPPDGNYGDIAVSASGATWTVRPETITYSKLQNGSALSVLGVTGNAVADLADIVAGADTHVLRRAGTTLAFGQVATGGIADQAITYSKMQNAAGVSVLGRSPNSTGAMSSIVASADDLVLLRAGGALSFGTIATGGITNDAVTYDKIQNVSATARIMGRISGGAGNMEELTGTQATSLLDYFTSGTRGVVQPSGTPTGKFLRDDNTWQVPSGGGGGITNGAAADEMMKSDNVNAVSSGIFSFTEGSLTLGKPTTGGVARGIVAEGSGPSVGISLTTKGTGTMVLQANTGGVAISGSNYVSITTNQHQLLGTSGAADVVLSGPASAATHFLRSGPGDASLNDGRNLTISSGSAYGGAGTNGNGGTLTLRAGTKFGSGTEGDVLVDAHAGNITAQSYNFIFNNGSNFRTINVSTQAGSTNTVYSNSTLEISSANIVTIAATTNMNLTHGSASVITMKNDANAREIIFNTNASLNSITSSGQALEIVAGTGLQLKSDTSSADMLIRTNRNMSIVSTTTLIQMDAPTVSVIGATATNIYTGAGGTLTIGHASNTSNIVINTGAVSSRYLTVNGLPTSSPGGTNRFWKDGSGYVRIT